MLEAKLDQFSINAPGPELFTLVEFTDSGAPSASPLISEEEGDPVPAHNATESTFTAAAGATATRADDPASVPARTAPPTRYKVRVVNTHASDRLYVARTQVGAQDTNAEVVEADYGVWEDFLDPSVLLWVRPAGTNSITVRLIQYATT